MTAKNFVYFLLLSMALFISSNKVHAFDEPFEEDLENSKKMPLISGIDKKEILENGQAAITVCTTPIKGFLDCEYEHVYLVFEIKDAQNPKEISLFSVHFGGDGHSSHVKKGRPILDNRANTLIKVWKGKKKRLFEFTTRDNRTNIL